MNALRKKKEKPAFARNFIARRKERGWNARELAHKAKIPFPTLRDIERGHVNGLFQTKSAIAAALGCTLSELESDPNTPKPMIRPSDRDLRALILEPRKVPFGPIALVLEEFANSEPGIRATVLAILFDDQQIAGLGRESSDS